MSAEKKPFQLPSASLTDTSILVLLVDDQAMVGEAVRRALAPENDIDFHFCSDPSKVVALAEQLRPTVILQDLLMPGVDGLQLLAAFREAPSLRDVPIIMLSTRDDPGIKSAAFAAGANDYLVKLPDVIEMVARIRYHSRSYIAMQQRDEAFRALRESQQQLLDANITLHQLMNSDGLTSLSNRRHFDEYLDMEWRRAQREDGLISLLMIDVDHFKPYNDNLGHLAGDDALRRVARCLKEACSRPADLVARYGGEEFVMVLPGTGAGGARLIGEKIRRDVQALAIPHHGMGADYALTISVGVATLQPQAGQASLELVDLADNALYQAKHNGRNQVAVVAQPQTNSSS